MRDKSSMYAPVKFYPFPSRLPFSPLSPLPLSGTSITHVCMCAHRDRRLMSCVFHGCLHLVFCFETAQHSGPRQSSKARVKTCWVRWRPYLVGFTGRKHKQVQSSVLSSEIFYSPPLQEAKGCGFCKAQCKWASPWSKFY